MTGATTGRDVAVERALLKLRELPPLPPVIRELSATLSDDQASYAAIAQALSRDPPLTARILGLANSAYYGMAGRVHSVQGAVRVLGLTLVRGVAMGMCLMEPLDTRRCANFRPEDYWLSSLLTALAARRLSPLVTAGTAAPPAISEDLAYLGGLLHRIGVIALIFLRPDVMEPLLSPHGRDGTPLSSLEEHHLQLNHRQAGAWLLWRWRLPGPLPRVAAHYAERGYRGEDWKLCTLVGLASRWADGILAGDSETPWDNATLAALGIAPKLANRLRGELASAVSLREIAREMAERGT
ncbi:MAG TPA: HDOD domain-containing protein [Chromatiales bacterium]|nr:HDOD domain-containing protein [Chromatiales bacterium]